MKKNLLLLCVFIFITIIIRAQETKPVKSPGIIPYVEAAYGLGLCGESNPVSFSAGIRQPLSRKLSLVYDINYWSTRYENFCCDVHSIGKYSALTPSVRLLYYLGKGESRGFFVGGGIGYMFAKDRGTEQPFTYNTVGERIYSKSPTAGNWDFNSVAPSVTFGVAFSIARLPVSINSTSYFAKTTYGWQAVSSGIGLNIGLKKRR
jgi:hypothetical protein